MGYYLRAFCTSSEIPSLRHALEWAATYGAALEIDGTPAELDSEDWKWAEIRYKPANEPLVVDLNRAGAFLAAEVGEFLEFLEDEGASPEKEKVLKHLRDTQAIIGAQLLGDIDDDGHNAVRVFLAFYVENCGGMIQADHEGFYEGDRLIVRSL